MSFSTSIEKGCVAENVVSRMAMSTSAEAGTEDARHRQGQPFAALPNLHIHGALIRNSGHDVPRRDFVKLAAVVDCKGGSLLRCSPDRNRAAQDFSGDGILSSAGYGELKADDRSGRERQLLHPPSVHLLGGQQACDFWSGVEHRCGVKSASVSVILPAAAAAFTAIAGWGRAGPQLVGAAAGLAARNWLWPIGKGIVKSAVQPKSGSRCTGPLLQGASPP